MGGKTITITGLVTPEDIRELIRLYLLSSGDDIVYISQVAMNELLMHPDVRNTFIWLDPKSLGEGFITLYGVKITFYNDN